MIDREMIDRAGDPKLSSSITIMISSSPRIITSRLAGRPGAPIITCEPGSAPHTVGAAAFSSAGNRKTGTATQASNLQNMRIHSPAAPIDKQRLTGRPHSRPLPVLTSTEVQR
jgi:hypothetical protein